MKSIQPIISKEDHEKNLERIANLMEMDDREGLSECEHAELGARALLADDFERNNYPIPNLNPIETLLFVMERSNLRPVDLVTMGIFSTPSRASERFNYGRKLTLAEIRQASQKLHIPLELLIQDYELRRDSTTG